MRQIARGILAAAILHGMAHEIQILLQIDVEWWHRPVALRLLGLLLHAEDSEIVIELDHPSALELLNAWLLMAHDATGVLLLGEIYEFLEAEE